MQHVFFTIMILSVSQTVHRISNICYDSLPLLLAAYLCVSCTPAPYIHCIIYHLFHDKVALSWEKREACVLLRSPRCFAQKSQAFSSKVPGILLIALLIVYRPALLSVLPFSLHTLKKISSPTSCSRYIN